MGDFLLTPDVVMEILLVLGVSFVGATIHEYVFRSDDHRHFFKNPNIWVSTVVSSIICYTINPLISDFNPRLMLLPPLLLGMAGMDLVKRLATPEGSSSLIEYILGFFGVTNKKTDGQYGIPQQQVQPEDPPEEEPPTNQETQQLVLPNHALPTLPSFESLMNLDNMVQSVLDKASNLIVDYYTHRDKEDFLRRYTAVKMSMEMMKSHALTHQFVPITTALKMSEILKKNEKLVQLYNEITTSQGGAIDPHDATSN